MPSDVAPEAAREGQAGEPVEQEVRPLLNEDEHGLVVEIPLPWDGSYSDLRVTCSPGRLFVHGRRHHGSPVAAGARGTSSFSADIPIAEPFELRGVKAALREGILRISVPRRETSPSEPSDLHRQSPTELPANHVERHPDDVGGD